jgi:hypothetical protein
MSEHQYKTSDSKQTVKPPAEKTAPAPDPLIELQRMIGNQGVQRMLSPEGASTKPPLFIQTKMTVGAANDPYEAEADRVAGEVMRMSDPVVQRAGEDEEIQAKRVDLLQREGEEDELQAKRVDLLQREGEEDELQAKRVDIVQRVGEEDELQAKRVDLLQREGEEDEMLQTSREDLSGSFEVGGEIEETIGAHKGGGQPLPDAARSFFEPRFGQDFGDVRVHTGGESDNLNHSINARAFTTGNDIFVRSSDYNPDSSGGRELLAHELTHVVQQTGGQPLAQAKRDEAE